MQCNLASGITTDCRYGSTASFIFAYQGQSIFLEVMREMKKPEAFPKTVGVANITMMLVYLTITMICYHYKGDTLPPFLPDVCWA